MRIKQLHFKNINSLKGEHHIDFDKEPLIDAGIFAITGPTGAGKSTLLDVITLALFNKIPRFKKAISKGEMTNEGSVLTHFTKEAFAQISYESKGNTYVSRWEIAKNRNDKLKDYEMTLFDVDGVPMDLKRSEVPARNEQLIGLNYQQFIKSILLSQGAFSKFLKADKNERGQLLENLTGTGIYRTLGIRAFDKAKQSKNALETAKEGIQHIQVFTEEQRKEKQAQFKKGTAKLQESATALAALRAQEQRAKAQQELAKKFAQYQKDIAKWKQATEAFLPKQKQLEAHQKVQPFQSELVQYKQSQEEQKKLFAQLEQEKKAIQKEVENQETFLEDASKWLPEGSSKDANTIKAQIRALEQAVHAKDVTLANLKDKGKEQRNNVKQLLESSTIALDSNAKPSQALVEISSLKQEATAYFAKAGKVLQTAPAKLHEDLQAIKKEIQEHHKGISLLEGMKVQIERQEKVKKEGQTLTKEIQEKETERRYFSEKLEGENKLRILLEEKKGLLQKQKEDAIKIAKLSTFRAQLQEGEPCSLCGALEHPYAKGLPENKGSLESKIEENIKALKVKEKECKQLDAARIKAATTIENAKKQELVQAKELTDIENKLGQLHQELQEGIYTGVPLSEENIALYTEKAKSQQEKRQETLMQLEHYTQLLQVEVAFKALADTMQLFQDAHKERQTLSAENDIRSFCAKKIQRYEGIENNYTRLQESVKIKTEHHEKLGEVIAQTHTVLEKATNSLGFETIQVMEATLLHQNIANSIQEEGIQLDKTKHALEEGRKQDLAKEKALVTQEGEVTMESLPKVQEAILSVEKERELQTKAIGTLEAELTRDKKDQTLLAKQQSTILSLEKEYQKWANLKSVIGDAQGNVFANFAQGLTLQNLLAFANRRLENLSDRYLLDKPSKDGPLVIVDRFQGNTTRSVTTLSGGESFLVSLALALSLSDMASKNVALESLFIDEGFGTLDQDTLEMALNTLEKLQSEGQKRVGVISHVEALKERIQVQIQLQKNSQGYSSIRVQG